MWKPRKCPLEADLVSLIGLITIVPTVWGIIAYDCGHERVNLTAISLVSVGPCIFDNKEMVKEEEDIQLLQTSETTLLHIFQCKINIIQSVYKCGMFSHLSLVPGGLSTFIMDISKDHCMNIHRYNTLRLQNGRTVADIKTNASTSLTEVIGGSIDQNGNCNGVPYTSGANSWDNVVVMHAMEITITDYQSSVRIDDKMVILRNNVLCPYLAGKCTDPEYGMSFLDLIPDNSCESQKYDVLWQGIATKIRTTNKLISSTIYTVTSGEIIFALEIKKQVSVCRFPGFQTEHPRLVIVPKAASDYWFSKRPLDTRNLDLFTYVNSKFVYVEHHFKGQVEKLYTNLLRKKCELERELLQTQLMMALHHPAEFALIRMKEQGFTAVHRGEVIYLVKCQPVEVTVRKSNRCYMELPVTYGENDYFLAPLTHLLQQRGTEIICSDLLGPAYYIRGNWYGVNPTIHQIKEPSQLQPSNTADWSYEDPGELIRAGIYHSESLENLRHQIMYPAERLAITNILTQRVMGQDVHHQDINAVNLLSPKTMEDLVTTVRTKVWGAFNLLGNVCSTLLGIYVCLKAAKFIIDTFINARVLGAIYGRSWKLSAALWNTMTNHILHQQHQHQQQAPACPDSVTTHRPQDCTGSASSGEAQTTPSLEASQETMDEISMLKNRVARLYPNVQS